MKRRQFLVFGALAITLAAAYWAPDAQEGLAQPVTRNVATSPASPIPAVARSPDFGEQHVTDIALPRLRVINDEPLGLFVPPTSAGSLSPPPEPTIVPEPPPQAPPLPFHFLGRYLDEGRHVVFVLFNERTLAVRAGDVVDGLYRVQAIDGAVMSIVYLPLKQTQTLEIGTPL